MHNDLAEVLFTEDEIAVRVGEMGRAITRDYACTADEGGIVLVSVLRGAAIFMADLARRIELPVEMDYLAVSSYGNGAKSSGVVRILKDLTSEIEGRHVIVAEDILWKIRPARITIIAKTGDIIGRSGRFLFEHNFLGRKDHFLWPDKSAPWRILGVIFQTKSDG